MKINQLYEEFGTKPKLKANVFSLFDLEYVDNSNLTPELLKRIIESTSKILRCNVKVNKEEVKASKPFCDIILKTNNVQVIILKKKPHSYVSMYQKKKLYYKHIMINNLLKEANNRAMFFNNMATEEDIDANFVLNYKKIIEKTKDLCSNLEKLRKENNKPDNYKALYYFKNIYTSMKSISICKDDLEDHIYKINRAKEIDGESGTCESCYRKSTLIKFSCEHKFCSECLQNKIKECSKSVLVKCPLPNCYNILSDEIEDMKRYEYPPQSADWCIICCDKNEDNLIACKKEHSICKKCLKEYVEWKTKGVPINVNSNFSDGTKPSFNDLPCPVNGCRGNFNAKKISTLYSDTEIYLISNYVKMTQVNY